MLLRRARCESLLRPRAISPGGHLGLFQFLKSTWHTTPYGSHDPLFAKWSSLGAAWMERAGRGGEWACQ